MTLMYPLGLLGLIGVPILIIIYIIKSKYMEQTIASTYLWTLSEKFLKRRNPISKLAGIISLILQILIIVLISLIISRPILSLPNEANEYCFVLDASGSMNMEKNGTTRFENGKEKIAEIIDTSKDGSIFTLIYVGDTTNVVYEKTEDKEIATELLYELKPAYDNIKTDDAIKLAQDYFNDAPHIITYLVTDKIIKMTNNVKVQDMSRNEDNHAIVDASYSLVDGELTVVGNAISYSGTKPLNFEVYLNGGNEPEELKSSGFLIESVPTAFTLSCKNQVESISQIKIKIKESDALSLDNEYIMLNPMSEHSYNTLLVSDEPFLIQSAVEAFLNTKIEVMSEKEYAENQKSGFGLYIFDSYSPEALPKDGAVWLINIDSSIEKSGFSVQGHTPLGTGVKMELTDSTASLAKSLTKDILGEELYIAGEYLKYGLYRSFTPVFTYQQNPMIFAGANDYGNRQVVFAFDINNSNIALKSDYLVLIRNLIEYSFPDVVEKTTYECGEEIVVNVLANCSSIKVESPLQNISYLDVNNAVSTLKLTEVGTYKITMVIGNSQERVIELYSAMNKAESVPISLDESFVITGEAKSGGLNGRYDPLNILFILLAVVFLADWVVYCYEKCKLR